METFNISVYDNSPQLGDMRNPSVLCIKMRVQTTQTEAVLIYKFLKESYPEGRYFEVAISKEITTHAAISDVQ